ncbi:MFS transporter [Winogradskyella luteola]|uniref:MFS transporter n=1 Tax=Winogradskyella luteola TaxID=2828330 RepID=A0A9X1JQY6_9FLAO|nr:MFS transporter [Winogradskyella luteola]MBV7269393.1 MFS transporter [Winogradskyella luteola]
MSSTRVPIGQKAAFGAGHLINNLIPGILGVFVVILKSADGFGMDTVLAGLIVGIPRLFDAITDPVMGYVSDNTSSRFGRRRPYIFIGAILSGAIFAILWQVHDTNPEMYNFWYLLIFSILLIFGNTIFSTPLIALGYEMTSDYKERTRLMSFANIIGQVAWMLVPFLYVLIPDGDLFASQPEGVRIVALIAGFVIIILGILPAIFCRGIDSSKMEGREEITPKALLKSMGKIFTGIKLVLKNKPFVKLCLATFLVFNGFQIVAEFGVFIINFYMFDGDWGASKWWVALFPAVTAAYTAFIAIPIINWMANKMGKRKAFIYATLISMFGYALKWWGFDPDNYYMIFLPIPLMAFGMGCLFTLMMSMTADVCDLDELENGMPRKEGTFGAIYWWMIKVGQGLALVFSGIILKLLGYDPTATTQTAEALTGMRITDIALPVLTAGLAIWVMWKYSLTEERAREIKDELVERRGEL